MSLLPEGHPTAGEHHVMMKCRWRGKPILSGPEWALEDCQWSAERELRATDLVVLRRAYVGQGGVVVYHLIARRSFGDGEPSARLAWLPDRQAVRECRARLDAAGIHYVCDEALGCLR